MKNQDINLKLMPLIISIRKKNQQLQDLIPIKFS